MLVYLYMCGLCVRINVRMYVWVMCVGVCMCIYELGCGREGLCLSIDGAEGGRTGIKLRRKFKLRI